MEKILVLDFGGQYSNLIARRVRDIGVFSEILPYNTPIAKIRSISPNGIILSGGPNSIYDNNSLKCSLELFDLGIPVLGICYGMQLIADLFGGEIQKAIKQEYGKARLKISQDSTLLKLDQNESIVWMSHSDSVVTAPPGFNINASTELTPIAAFSNAEKQIYALQFHPEVNDTVDGTQYLTKFLTDVCKLKLGWSMQSFIEATVEKIRLKVGKEKVLCALSGGVDSSVTALLLHKALGKQLDCVFVDHGLLREGEANLVYKTFVDNFDMNLEVIDAKKQFLGALTSISDPEQKRKIIGKEFINIFEQKKDYKFLGQGTLYTDIIESGTDLAHTIKSHHNVGGLPDNMRMSLVEPLNSLFKDEAREVGRLLNLPSDIVDRQPFPGPGLAIRVLGEISEEKLDIVRKADLILHQEILEANLNNEIWQYFALLPNVLSVGVMGDSRTYCHTICIRAVSSVDGMTADWARIPYEVLEKISVRIVNEVKDVNRVVYDITSKPPSTIEWE